MTNGTGPVLHKVRSLTGCCSVCGTFGVFTGPIAVGLSQRDLFACEECGTTLRYRDQTTAILQHFAGGATTSLDGFVQTTAPGLDILEFGLRGPFVQRLRTLPKYRQAYLFDDVPLGEEHDGVYCEDIRQTTFADETFDLIITSDVMEHVSNWREAVAEMGRLLRPGGAHIFTIPLRWPIPPTSRVRATIVGDEIVHLVPPRYHVSGTGGQALVFTDFGADLLDEHATAGLDAWFFSSQLMVEGLHRHRTVVAAKASAGRLRSDGEAAPAACGAAVAARRTAARRRDRQPPAAIVNRLRCTLCGWRDIRAGGDALAADCPVCRATSRSMHLGAILLRLGGRGMGATLSHLAGDGLGGHAVLDLTGDPALRTACRPAADYVAHALVESTEGAAEDVGEEVMQAVAGYAAASADIVLLRDVLRLVPDLREFVASARRLLRPRGAVVFQDQFLLPLPASTRSAGQEPPCEQTVVRNADAAPSGYVKLAIPIRRHLGADLLNLLAENGLAPTVEWPPAPSLFSHRHVVVLARAVCQRAA